jgi:beta-glucosidase
MFPKGFLWGAATSAFQVEGGISGMDWEKAAQEGKVPLIGRAADHYNRYEDDFDIAKQLGHTAHRFSIEWARIEPREGVFDEQELEHYRNVLRALHARGITPFITLWHFTLPLWFSETGGFERQDAPEIFARYCARVVSGLGDFCTFYSTINEPNVYAAHGWLYGAWPPFKRAKLFGFEFGKNDGTSHSDMSGFKNIITYLRVVQNLIRAHNRAYDAIKKVRPDVDVSIVKHVRFFEANKNPVNRILARVAAYTQSGYFMNRVYRHCDSIGLNYYRHTKFGDTRTYEKTDMGWDIAPEHIYGALTYLWRYKKPIYISEAGIADARDVHRAAYIRDQVRGTWHAIQDGVDVRAHLYWSLLDNYELALGYEKRFGLVEINYDTLERRIRPSAYIYKEICETNSVEA